MEERGSGIRRIREAMTKNGLDEPVFDLVGDGFAVTLRLPKEAMTDSAGWKDDTNLSMNERAVLDFIHQNGLPMPVGVPLWDQGEVVTRSTQFQPPS